MTLWTEIKKMLTDNPKPLKASDIESDINWLYKEQNLSKPEICIYKSMKQLTIKEKESIQYEDRFYGLYHELEFFAYWKTTDQIVPDDVKRYINFLAKGIYYAVFKDDKAIICMLPKQISLDKQNEFHSVNDKAILWHDGSGKYFIHGIKYDKQLFNQVKDLKLTYDQVRNTEPIKELKDNSDHTHSLKKEAVLYESRKKEYWIHGVRFLKSDWNQISKRTMSVKRILNLPNANQFKMALNLYGRDRIITELSVKDILEIKNIERRHTMLKYFGKEKILNELPTTLIHKSKRGNELYKIEIDEHLTAQILLYKCPSTNKEYTKFVNHHNDYSNADHAMAESHNMTLKQYQSMEHEG